MKRKQEKLKEQILKEAAEYKAIKAQRLADLQAEEARMAELSKEEKKT